MIDPLPPVRRVPNLVALTGGSAALASGRRLRRVMLYGHDTYGLGHLRRNLAIAAHLLRTTEQLQVVLVSGSTVASRFPMPRGLSLVSLPPVVKVGPEQYASRDGGLGIGVVTRARAAIIADVARRFQPDVLLVDHAPQGMRGELLPTFETLRRHAPGTRIVLGLRDVLDDPATVRATWADQGILGTLEDVYDRILVYGSRELLDVGAAYGIPGRIRSRIEYCGYVAREASPVTPGSVTAGAAPIGAARPAGPYILGTAGGGEDGISVLRATLRAAANLGIAPLLVTGPLMSEAARDELVAEAAATEGARVVEFVPDLPRVMAGAAGIVTMGGYNTLSEAVMSGVPTVVVPRTWPRREQAIRARMFAERGLVRVVDPGEDLAARLANPLAEALRDGWRARRALDLGGAARVRDALVDVVGGSLARGATAQDLPFAFAGRELREEIPA